MAGKEVAGKSKKDEKQDAAGGQTERPASPKKKRKMSFKFGSKKNDDGTGSSKARWGKAITGVREIQKKAEAEKDTFLERFTVTGRSYSAENEAVVYKFKDYFTKTFYKSVVVDPSNENYFYWSMVVTVAVLYNILFIILRCVFPQPHEGDLLSMWLIIDYLCDCIYLMDMFIKSRIAFLEQGLLVRDVKRLTQRYLRTWKFPLDVASVLPTDIGYIWIQYSAVFRFNRILKIWRLKEFFQMAETHTNFPNFIRVSNLVLYIIIIIHWNACCYYYISDLIGFGTDDWVYPDPKSAGFDSFSKQFTFSLYWSTLTLTTIGDTMWPVTPAETLYCFTCALMGVLIFATIFGNVGAMINNMDAARNEFQNRVDNVKRYMELRGIGEELQNRVIKWFDYTWNNKQSIDDKEALQFLPEKLRAEISIHVHIHTLRRVAIFQDCEPGLLVELVLKLKLQVYSPGDFICRKGDIGKEMYIIKRGKLQVVSECGKIVFVTLSDGAVFGEISVLNIAGNKTGNRRTASVKTVGYSDLFCLTKNDLWEALEEYPDAKKMLLEKGKQLLRKDKLLDEEAAIREERRQQAMTAKIEIIVDAVDEIQTSIDKLYEKIDKITNQSKSRISMTGIDIVRPLTSVELPEKVSSAAKLRTPSPIQEVEEPDTKKDQSSEKSGQQKTKSDTEEKKPITKQETKPETSNEAKTAAGTESKSDGEKTKDIKSEQKK